MVQDPGNLLHKNDRNLTIGEFEDILSHILHSQAIGDLIYAATATELKRLGIGGTNDFLNVVAGIPTWGQLNLGPAVSATIASGAIAKTSHRHALVVEGGAGSGADIVATATGGADGDLLVLQPATSGANDQVTVQDGTGGDAFKLAGGINFVMDHVDDRLWLLHDGTDWVELTRSGNS